MPRISLLRGRTLVVLLVVLVVESDCVRFPSQSYCDQVWVSNAPTMFLPADTKSRPFASPYSMAQLSGRYDAISGPWAARPANSFVYQRRLPEFNTNVYLYICRSRWVFSLQAPPSIGECVEANVVLSQAFDSGVVPDPQTLRNPDSILYVSNKGTWFGSAVVTNTTTFGALLVTSELFRNTTGVQQLPPLWDGAVMDAVPSFTAADTLTRRKVIRNLVIRCDSPKACPCLSLQLSSAGSPTPRTLATFDREPALPTNQRQEQMEMLVPGYSVRPESMRGYNPAVDERLLLDADTLRGSVIRFHPFFSQWMLIPKSLSMPASLLPQSSSPLQDTGVLSLAGRPNRDRLLFWRSLLRSKALIFNSTVLYSPSLLALNGVPLLPIRNLTDAERATIGTFRLTIACASDCLSTTKSKTIVQPVLPYLWRWVVPGNREDFLRLEGGSDYASDLSSPISYIAKSTRSQYDGAVVQYANDDGGAIDTSLAVEPVAIRFTQPQTSSTITFSTFLLPANSTLATAVTTPQRLLLAPANWRAGLVLSTPFSPANTIVAYDDFKRPWCQLVAKSEAIRANIVSLTQSAIGTAEAIRRIFGQPIVAPSLWEWSYFTATELSLVVEAVLDSESNRRASDLLTSGGSNLWSRAPQRVDSMTGRIPEVSLANRSIRVDVVLTANFSLVNISLLARPCGCIQLFIANVFVADIVAPKCDELHIVSIRYFAVPRELSAMLLGNLPLRVELRRSCPDSVNFWRPLAIAAVLVSDDKESESLWQAASVDGSPRRLTCSTTEFRYDCNCTDAPDGSWCGVGGRTCFAGICSSCDPAKSSDKLSVTGSSGWAFGLGSCYIALLDALPATDAAQLCRLQGAELPSVPSPQHVALLQDRLTKLGLATGWVGGVFDVGTWSLRWIDGTVWNENNTWASLEPRTSYLALSSVSPGEQLCGVVTLAGVRLDYCSNINRILCARPICQAAVSMPFTVTPASSAKYSMNGKNPAGAPASYTDVNLNTMSQLLSPTAFPPLSLAAGSVKFDLNGQYDYFSFCTAVDNARPCGRAPSTRTLQMSIFDQTTQNLIWFNNAEASHCATVPVRDQASITVRVNQLLSSGGATCEYLNWFRPQLCAIQGFGQSLCPPDWFYATRGRCVRWVNKLVNFTSVPTMCRNLHPAARPASILSHQDATRLSSKAFFYPLWSGISAAGSAFGQIWTDTYGASWLPYREIASADFPAAAPETCLYLQNASLWEAGLCQGGAGKTFYCEVFPSQSYSLTLSETDSVEGLTATATLEATSTDVLSISSTIPLTETEELTLSTSWSVTQTVSEDTLTLTGSSTATRSLDIVPGIMSLLESNVAVPWLQLAYTGTTMQIVVDGDAFRRPLRPNVDIFFSSQLWEHHWGKGVAVLANQYGPQFVTLSFDNFNTSKLNLTFGPDTFGASPIANDEYLVIDFSPKAFRSGVKPRGLPLTLVIIGDHQCEGVCLTRRAARYLTLAVFILQMLFRGDFSYIMELLTLSVFLQADCNAEADLLPFAIHPLQFEIGLTPYRYSYGCAVANIALLIGCVLIHLLVTWIVKEKKGYKFQMAAALVMFPGLSYFFFAVLTPGIMIGASALVGFGTTSEIVLGAFIFVAWLLVMLLMMTPMARTRKFNARFIEAVNGNTPVSFVDAYLIAGEILNAPKFFFAPRGVWTSSDRDLNFIPRYRWCFVDYVPGASWFGVYNTILVGCFSILQSIRAFTSEACVIITGGLAVLLLLHLLLLVTKRPFRRRGHFIVSVVVTLLIGASIGAQVSGFFWPSAAPERTSILLGAFFVLSCFMLFWVLIRLAQMTGFAEPFPKVEYAPELKSREAFQDASQGLLEALINEAKAHKAAQDAEEEALSSLRHADVFVPSQMMLTAAESLRREKEAELAAQDEAIKRRLYQDRRDRELQLRKAREAMAEDGTSDASASDGDFLSFGARTRSAKANVDHTLNRIMAIDSYLMIEGRTYRVMEGGRKLELALKPMTGRDRIRLESDYVAPLDLSRNEKIGDSFLSQSFAERQLTSGAKRRVPGEPVTLDEKLEVLNTWDRLGEPPRLKLREPNQTLDELARSLNVSFTPDPPRWPQLPPPLIEEDPSFDPVDHRYMHARNPSHRGTPSKMDVRADADSEIMGTSAILSIDEEEPFVSPVHVRASTSRRYRSANPLDTNDDDRSIEQETSPQQRSATAAHRRVSFTVPPPPRFIDESEDLFLKALKL
jgi:hypothetical protein